MPSTNGKAHQHSLVNVELHSKALLVTIVFDLPVVPTTLDMLLGTGTPSTSIARHQHSLINVQLHSSLEVDMSDVTTPCSQSLFHYICHILLSMKL